MYLRQRDVQIRKFVEDYGSITAKICSLLFFDGNNSYYCASRRLKILYENKFLKRYRASVNQDYIYYNPDGKPLKYHKLKLLEIYSHLSRLGDINTFEIEYGVLCSNKKRKIDGVIELEVRKGGYEYTYPLLIEIDMTHDTGMSKIKDIKDSGHFQELYGDVPTMIIVKKNDFQKRVYVDGICIIYLNWNLEGIEDIFNSENEE